MDLTNLSRYKLGTTKKTITSYAGLGLVWGVAKGMRLEEKLNALRLKRRNRGYKPAETVFTLMGIMQSGGDSLEDVRELDGDEGIRALIGETPAANTIGEFLRRFENRTLHGFGRIVLASGVKVIDVMKFKTITLDVDAFTLESQKSSAAMNYKGEVGFTPIAVSCAELKMPLAGLFRPGNASPMANIAALLERVITALPGKKICVRSDSAGYQAKVIGLCEEKGADFTVTVREDAAVKEAIAAIAESEWRLYEDSTYPGRVTEIAETVHAFGKKETKAHRMIVLRWRRTEIDLFNTDAYGYHAVMTSKTMDKAERILAFHRQRQDGSENMNKELIHGYGLSKLPCVEMKANAAYFQIALLAMIVMTGMKYLALPDYWRSYTIKTIRRKLIRMAGVIVWHARYVWMKIPEIVPHRKVFEDSRWRILGLEAEFARL